MPCMLAHTSDTALDWWRQSDLEDPLTSQPSLFDKAKGKQETLSQNRSGLCLRNDFQGFPLVSIHVYIHVHTQLHMHAPVTHKNMQIDTYVCGHASTFLPFYSLCGDKLLYGACHKPLGTGPYYSWSFELQTIGSATHRTHSGFPTPTPLYLIPPPLPGLHFCFHQ